MGRKSQYINIIIHPPEDQQSIDEIQEAINDHYAYIIEKKLSMCDLTPEERVRGKNCLGVFGCS